MVLLSWSADESKLTVTRSFGCLYLFADGDAPLGLCAHSVAWARAVYYRYKVSERWDIAVLFASSKRYAILPDLVAQMRQIGPFQTILRSVMQVVRTQDFHLACGCRWV